MSNIRTSSQSGMVSIMVTMLLMIVISLIVLGFAQVSRREQTEVLDRQLSSQAFFAAESGVNDARNVIKDVLANGGKIEDKNTCGPDTNYPKAAANPTIDTDNNVSYTCLLVSTQLDNVTGEVAAGGSPLIQNIEPVGGPIDSFHIVWRGPGQTSQSQVDTCNTAAGVNKVLALWSCPYGVMRIDLVPTDTLSRGNLDTGQKTMFLYPRAGTGTPSVPVSNGGYAAMNCVPSTNVPDKDCSIDITGISGSNNYALKISSLYREGKYTISARKGGVNLLLNNAQVQIDVTGRAKDVLRRIRVRLPMTAPATAPDNAIISGSSICKHYQYDGTSLTTPAATKPQDTNNPMCGPSVVTPPPPPPPVCGGPHDIILTLDTSESMLLDWEGDSRRDQLKKLAVDFVDASNVGRVNHEALIGFSGRVTFSQGFSANPGQIKRNIQGLPTERHTEYYVAMKASRDMFRSARPATPKVLIFISDGEDQNGRVKEYLKLAEDMKNKDDVTIYGIGINPDKLRLKEMQQMASPGYFANAENVAQLKAIFAKVAREVSCVTP